MPIPKFRQIFFIGLIGLMTLVPIFFQVKVLITTGVDSISNDYIRFTSLADRVLSPGYDWRGYFKDSLDNNVHDYAFLFLVRLFLAELTHLSVMAEIYLGLAIASVNLLLLYAIFAHFSGSTSPLRFLFLPVLSTFLFSYSQISTYSYGESALQRGFTHLGILIGLWLLLFRSKASFTPWAMMICGVLASFSGAGGLLAWPVFIFAILITHTGSRYKYIAWILGLGMGASPYLVYAKINPENGLMNPIIIDRVLTGLGLPLANNINYGIQEHPQAFLSGLIGMGIMIFVVFLLFLSKSKTRFKIAIPSLIIIFWGISGAGEIASIRYLLAPWYTSEYVLFWIGLAGLCFGMIWPDSTSIKQKLLFIQRDKVIQIAGFSGLLVMAFLFLQTNLTYGDKSFYLDSRSPTSAACLRNYQTAPTYCEGFVFQWGVGNPTYLPKMAAILDKYNWSVLSPHQEWTLQGDYIFGNVSQVSQNGPEHIRWVIGGLDQPSYWNDYHHLNLLLNPGQTILWQIDLPPNLSDASFTMGLSLTDKATCLEQNLSIRIETSSEAPELVFQQRGLCNFVNEVALNENLLDYAGKRAVIRISNEGNPDTGKDLRLYYPRILIDENPLTERDNYSPVEVRPLNTDLSPNFLALNGGENKLQVLSTENPETQDLQLESGTDMMVRSGPVPSVALTPSQPVCLLNWSRFTFNFAMTDAALKKVVRIGFHFRDDQETGYDVNMDFPLLAGEDPHAYSLDLALFNLPDSFCITNIKFSLFVGTPDGPDQWAQIKNVGFIARTDLRFGFLQQ